MQVAPRVRAGRFLSLFALFFSLFTPSSFSQSTANLTGAVTDATGAVIPGATVSVRNLGTGEERSIKTDDAGNYLAASLPVGNYRVEVKAPGMQPVAVSNLVVEVGRTVQQNFTVKPATTSETVEIVAQTPLIDTSTTSVGSVIDQRTVQEIPLNGRHFVDLALLIPGSVTV